MGILSTILGNASEVDIEKLEADFERILVEGEEIAMAFKLIRDMFVFTTKRLVIVDRQGLTGKKAEYHSFPYKSITHFSVETPGHFDADCELKIWISSHQEPISKEIRRGVDILRLQKALAGFVLK